MAALGRAGAEAAERLRGNLLVLGGSGYVGAEVCRRAVAKGLAVTSLSRGGAPRGRPREPWMDHVSWRRGDLLQPAVWRRLLPECSAVISTVGIISPSNAEMRRVCGEANVLAIEEARRDEVLRFAYVSAHDYRLPSAVLRGYFEGKRQAEAALAEHFPKGGVALRPGFIHGTRYVGGMGLPLQLAGAPLEAALGNSAARALSGLLPGFLGAALAPPVSVGAVAEAALAAVADESVPAGLMDVWAIRAFSPAF